MKIPKISKTEIFGIFSLYASAFFSLGERGEAGR